MYIFIDGSCIVSEKVGGWSYIIVDKAMNIVASDFGKVRGLVEESCKSEIEACYQAFLKATEINIQDDIVLYADSEVLVKSIRGVSKRRNYREIWDNLEPLLLSYAGRLKLEHVRSHKGADSDIKIFNKIADRFAKNAIDNLLIKPVNN